LRLSARRHARLRHAIGRVPAVAHLALIVNPLATAVDEHRVAAVERALGRYGEIKTRFTERRGHATELARESAGADAIFVLSGDGGFGVASLRLILGGVSDPRRGPSLLTLTGALPAGLGSL